MSAADAQSGDSDGDGGGRRGVPAISVVVPTFNRRETLHRVLSGLASQDCTQPFEVIVVSDGSTDGTNEYLLSSAVPLPVVPITQQNGGPAAARNRGVDAARAPLVLFVDDDVVAGPSLVREHLAGHAASAGDTVIIGPMLTPSDVELSPWVMWEQRQLEKQYTAMQRGDWTATFRQFYTGNASLPVSCMRAAGMFDETYRRAEDIEFSYRLHVHGVPFAFRPSAEAFHYATRTFESWLATPRHYGRNDIAFARAGQDWLLVSLSEEFRGRALLLRTLVRVAAGHPRREKVALRSLRVLMRVTSATRARRVTQATLSALWGLQYYAGIADALGSRANLDRLLAGVDTLPPGAA